MGQAATYKNDPRKLVSIRKSVLDKINDLQRDEVGFSRKIDKILEKLEKYTVCMDETDNCNNCEDNKECEWANVKKTKKRFEYSSTYTK